MSEEWRQFFRNANIGIGVASVLLILGFWPAHRSEAAMTVLGAIAFAVGMGVFIALNLRAERRWEKEPPKSP